MTRSLQSPLNQPRRLFVLLLSLLLLVGACGSPGDETRFEYMRVTVDGQPTLGISEIDKTVRGVVIFFHGPNGNEFSMSSDGSHQKMTETLVDAGFAVVSSQASGDAFGNPESTRNYRELANLAVERYRAQNVFFLAESMGALSAINLFSLVETTQVRGLAAINPMLDLAQPPAQYSAMIEQAYPDRSVLDGANPMRLVPDRLQGKKFRFYVDPQDAGSGAATQVSAFESRFGSRADITTVECGGEAGSCFQGVDLLKWFSALERRVDS